MVVYKNKYQIQIPHAIWTLERHWNYAIAIFVSQLTFIRNLPLLPLYFKASLLIAPGPLRISFEGKSFLYLLYISFITWFGKVALHILWGVCFALARRRLI